MFLNVKKFLKFQNKKSELLCKIMLKWKLQIEKIKDPAICAKFVIFLVTF